MTLLSAFLVQAHPMESNFRIGSLLDKISYFFSTEFQTLASQQGLQCLSIITHVKTTELRIIFWEKCSDLRIVKVHLQNKLLLLFLFQDKVQLRSRIHFFELVDPIKKRDARNQAHWIIEKWLQLSRDIFESFDSFLTKSVFTEVVLINKICHCLQKTHNALWRNSSPPWPIWIKGAEFCFAAAIPIRFFFIVLVTCFFFRLGLALRFVHNWQSLISPHSCTFILRHLFVGDDRFCIIFMRAFVTSLEYLTVPTWLDRHIWKSCPVFQRKNTFIQLDSLTIIMSKHFFWLETSQRWINQKFTISNHARQDAKMIPDGVTGRKLECHLASMCFLFAAVSTSQTTRDCRMWAKPFGCELVDLIGCHLFFLSFGLSFKIAFAKLCNLRKKGPSYLRSIKFLFFFEIWMSRIFAANPIITISQFDWTEFKCRTSVLICFFVRDTICPRYCWVFQIRWGTLLLHVLQLQQNK